MKTFDTLFVQFQVAGKPRGKGSQRHRVVFTKGGGAFAHGYKDQQTAEYLAAVGWRAAEAMRGKKPFSGPVALVVTSVLAVPKSWTAQERRLALAHELRPDVKPDWDNIGKSCDGMKGIVWDDDARVVDGRVLKFYGLVPFTQIEVYV